MKNFKSFVVVTFTVLSFIITAPAAFAGNDKGPGNRTNNGLSTTISNLPLEELNIEERTDLLKMREEEKLARDVYSQLYELWQAPIFTNISQNEQRHMDSIKSLLDKYDLIDPAADSTVGVFTNPEWAGLYELLIEQGSLSLTDALIVGATIEDLEIKDLQDFLGQTDNLDIMTVYQNLLKDSKNHLRADMYQISLHGKTYEARFITEAELADIITSPREKGRVDEGGEPIGKGNDFGKKSSGKESRQ